jgi:hypothetical protein
MSEPKSKAVPPKAAPAKAAPAKAAPAKADAKAPAEPDAKRSRLSWVAGWVLVPGAILGVLFGGGALVGAHFSESWLARLIVWVVELFA